MARIYGKFGDSGSKSLDSWILEDCGLEDTLKIFRSKGSPLAVIKNDTGDVFVLAEKEKEKAKVKTAPKKKEPLGVQAKAVLENFVNPTKEPENA